MYKDITWIIFRFKYLLNFSIILSMTCFIGFSVNAQHKLIKKFDKNSDNIVDRNEIPLGAMPPFFANRFNDIDCNKDNGITNDELMAWFRGGRGECNINPNNIKKGSSTIHRLVDKFDKDDSGTIELTEIPSRAMIKPNFNDIDCDQSGGIASKELTDYFRRGQTACPEGSPKLTSNMDNTNQYTQISGDLDKYSARLYKPMGTGPFPVIIMSHGSGGAIKGYFRWAKKFLNWQVASIVLDHYEPRGVKRAPNSEASIAWRREDLLSILQAIRGRSDIDRKNITLAGWSAGAYLVFHGLLDKDSIKGVGFSDEFKAEILFYPASDTIISNFNLQPIQIPTIFLTGENDRIWQGGRYEWKESIKDIKSDRDNFYLKVYPNVIHGFESFPQWLGKKCTELNCLEYDEKAHKLSIADLKTFTEKYIQN